MDQHGFSLIEILFSLLLVTTTVMGLLQTQIHTNIWLKQTLLEQRATLILDNAAEYSLIGLTNCKPPEPPFHLQINSSTDSLKLIIEWPEAAILSREIGSIS